MDSVELAIRMTADASDASRALEGVGDSATRMASDVDAATSKADSAASRLDSAADSADNMASKSSQAAGGLGDLGGALALMPGPLGAMGAGMEAAAPAIMGVTGAADLANLAMSSNIVTTTKARAAAIKHAAVSRVQAAATRAMAVAQRVLNLAMRANPIGLVITAVLLLVGAVVLAYKRSERFRQVVAKAMAVARAAVDAVIRVVSNLVAWLRDKAPAAWSTVKDKAVAAFNAVRDKVSAVVTFVREKLGSVATKATDIARTIRETTVAAFQAVWDKVDAIIGKVQDLIGWIKDIDFPSMPGWLGGGGNGRIMARGGGMWAPYYAGGSKAAMTAPGGDVYYITMDVSGVLTEAQAGDTIIKALDRYALRRGGRVVIR